MSRVDDESAEIEEKLDRAWQKCLYGRQYSPAFEVARRINAIRSILSAKEEGKADAELNYVERKYLLQTAGLLLISGITASKKLREIANALDAEQQESAGQANILRAYEDCVEGRYPPTIAEEGECFGRCYLPTIGELRDAFIKRFGEPLVPFRSRSWTDSCKGSNETVARKILWAAAVHYAASVSKRRRTF
jgi:hypothetical protein